MKVNSKKLGNNYERDVARKISFWISGSNEKLICWRNTHSGSISTIRKKQLLNGDNISGDFQCLDSQYESFFNTFNCDSKNLGDVHLCLINKNNIQSSQLFTNWIKVCKDSGNKIPIMLVKARKDRKIPDFIIVPEYLWCQYVNCMLYQITFQEKVYKFRLILQDEFFMLNDWKSLISQNSFLSK